jgi:hypothetical protein
MLAGEKRAEYGIHLLFLCPPSEQAPPHDEARETAISSSSLLMSVLDTYASISEQAQSSFSSKT